MIILDKEGPWRINHFGLVGIDSIKEEVKKYVYEWFFDISRQRESQTHELTNMYRLKELDYTWNLKDKIQSTSHYNFKTEKANKEIKEIYNKLENLVEGRVVRSEVINMLPNSRIRSHVDRSDVLYLSRRFHIPIITNKQCTFTVEKEDFHLEQGNLYELNNRRYHSVENASDENRIHLIIDVIPNDYTENIEFV